MGSVSQGNPLIFDYFFCPRDIVYLGRRKRAKNLINRKMGLFYIEAIPQFFSTSKKKNSQSQKICLEIRVSAGHCCLWPPRQGGPQLFLRFRGGHSLGGPQLGEGRPRSGGGATGWGGGMGWREGGFKPAEGSQVRRPEGPPKSLS